MPRGGRNRLGSDVLTVGRVAVSTEVKEEMQKILTNMRRASGWSRGAPGRDAPIR